MSEQTQYERDAQCWLNDAREREKSGISDRDSLAAMFKAFAERSTVARALGNLLAVIHRDGGHYQAEHGSEKAAKDAEALWCELAEQIDALKSELASAVGALRMITDADELIVLRAGQTKP